MIMSSAHTGSAEDSDVLFPVIINMDGFILSHVIEPIELIDQEKIDQFLPPYRAALHGFTRIIRSPWAPLPCRASLPRRKRHRRLPFEAPMPKIVETGRPSET